MRPMPRFLKVPLIPLLQLCLALTLALAPRAVAQAPAPDVSRAHAAQAIDLLMDRGDRPGALVEALKGLPAAPTEADLESYPEAWSALWRAYASRSITYDGPEGLFTTGYLSPDGRRVLVGQQIAGTTDPNARVTMRLIDQASSTVLAEYVSTQPIGEPWLSMGAAGFSPDGRVGAVALQDGQTILIDAESGAELGRLAGNAIQILFAPDGAHVILQSMDGSSVQSVAELTKVLDFPDPFVTSFAWASDGTVLAANVSRDAKSADIVAYGLDGTMRPILAGVERMNATLKASLTEPVFAVSQDLSTVLFSLDGARLAEFPFDSGMLSFLRNGSVVGFAAGESERMSDIEVKVFAFDGTPLETEPRDFVDFNQAIYASSGAPAGFIVTQRHAHPLVESVPTGLALHEAAVALVGGSAVAMPASAAAPALSVDAAVEASEGFAREAERLLLTGDRQGAIRAALKGLPEAATEADFERFAAAHVLLYRSVAARVLRLPFDEPSFPRTHHTSAIVAPDGAVMATTSEHGAQLYAMPDGALIADLRKPDGAKLMTWNDPLFTSTGDRVVIAEMDGPGLHVFDGRSGARLGSVTIPVPDLERLLRGYAGVVWPTGIAHDDSAVLVDTPKGHFRVGLSDFSVTPLPLPERAQFQLYWLPDGNFLALRSLSRREDEATALEVHLYDGQALTRAFSILRDPDGVEALGGAGINRQGNALFVGGDRNVIFDATGARRVSFFDSEGEHAFLRDGTAIGYPDPRGTLGDSLKVLSILSGETLPSELADYPVFDQALFDMEGNRRTGKAPPLGGALYRGADVPTGAALVDLAMAGLDEAARAEVVAERILRD